MFDNFSTRARQLVFAARFKAGERGAAVIDTDDLLVGLVLEDQGLLVKALFPDVEENAFVRNSQPHVPFFSHKLAVDLLTELKKSLPRSEPVPETTEIPLSSSLERVFDLAKELQPQFRHSQRRCETPATIWSYSGECFVGTQPSRRGLSRSNLGG